MFLDQIEYIDGGKMEGNREIILKARQLGFSTLLLALFYCDTVNNPHTYTVVMAQDQPSTERLFQIVKRYHDNCPPHKKLQAKYESKRELYWPSIDSYFFIGTAGSKEKFGRGGTINNVHGSEVAFWDNAEEIVAGLLETVPQSGNIFLETTANGVGNYFYEEYSRAQSNESEFKVHFFPWFYSSEYRTSLPTNTPVLEKTEHEVKLAEKFNLDDEQLLWYRMKGVRLKELLVQEHPSSPEEAFIATGAGYFNNEALVKLAMSCAKAEKVPVPVRYDQLRRVSQEDLIEEQITNKLAKNEELHVWKKPVPGKRYAIFADPAEGLRETGEHDFCSADVLDYDTWEQCASLHGRWEPYDFAILLAQLGRWYNFALLGVERNNHGHSVLNTLINVEGYERQTNSLFGGLYYHEEYDGSTKRRSAKPGYPTNAKTKVELLNVLDEAVSEGTVTVYNRDTVKELRMFSKLPGGKFGPEGKHHDDRVISLGGAVLLCRTKAPTKKKKTKLFIHKGGSI